ncbi:MAG: hypothetical protein JKY54_05645, partial [Flavobacteriales bacterium]|nr:hypothetical protein [Flavobacteriales bacterium]
MRILAILLILLPSFVFAQDNSWETKYKHQKVFIENIGQYGLQDEPDYNTQVHFAFPEQNQTIYFTNSGVVFEFIKKEKVKKSQEEKNARTQRKHQAFTFDEFNAFERVGHRLNIEKDYLHTQWLGANPNVTIITEDKSDFHYSYSFTDELDNTTNKNNIESFKRITYKNLYPNIDVVYEIHPESGIKYTAIIHPGGNVSDLQLAYSKQPTRLANGNISTKSMFGDIIDHAPLTFYQNNQQQTIASKYLIDNNVISFHVDNYDQTQTLVIDPWTQTPTFATNWDCIWECEHDAAGNVYIIGGVMPMQLIKYNSAGALQWTYNTPYDTTSWLGTFATDDAGNSYVTLGSTAAIQMVNTGGTVVWNNASPGGLFGSTEFWNISFNCDQTKLVIGGTGGTLPPLPYIYDVDMATGNILASVQVTDGALIPTQEVRAITACDNSRYYWLSHDSIGYIHQNFSSSCPSGSNSFKADNGYSFGYKCEDWRLNNTGIMAIASYGNYIFTHRGNEIHKRDFNTAGIIATASIPGGAWSTGFGGSNVENSGIAIDDCGNIYVGSKNGVVKYDQNLNQLATYPTSFIVYDVEVSTSGDIIAGGSTGDQNSGSRSGSIQSFAAGACAPLATTCCDATVCQPSVVCDTDPAFNLSPSVSGGTFSGTGITNASAGTFDPSVSGPGTFTVYYTQSCGMDSAVVTVNTCATLIVCIETNGDLTVSNGTGPYTWEEGTTVTSCVPGLGNCDGIFSFTDPGPPALAWNGLGSGTTITPPAGTDSIQVTDSFGNVFTTFNASGLLPCSSVPCDLVIVSGIATDETCDGADDGQMDITITGTDLYDITIGASTIFSGVGAGTHNINGQPDGTYTVTVTSTTDPSCTEDVIITIAPGPATTDPTISPAGPFCEGDAALNLTAASGGGTWSGTGITDASLGTFDPTIATAGTWTITYTIPGSCGGTDTEDIIVNADQSAAYTYAAGSFCLVDPNPLPTITGVTGGTFTIDNSGTINPTTGEIDIAASGANNYIVTYVSPGPCPGTETFNITLTSGADATITAVPAVCENDLPFNFVAVDLGGSWSGTGITDAVNGTFDPSIAGPGIFTISYDILGSCGDSDTESITVTASDDPTFSYLSGTAYCLADPDPTASVTGTGGGTFTIDNSGTINGANGQINLASSGVGSFIVTYVTGGSCPDSMTTTITIAAAFDATITAAGPFCSNDSPINLSAVDPGGTWSGTGITDPVNGIFDPATAGPGTFTITYDITGTCGDTDTESITVTAADDASFTFSAATYCDSDPNPLPTISGTVGGTFSISGGAAINSLTG